MSVCKVEVQRKIKGQSEQSRVKLPYPISIWRRLLWPRIMDKAWMAKFIIHPMK